VIKLKKNYLLGEINMKKIFIFILLFSFNTIYAFKTDKELTEYYQKIENKLTEEIHKIPKNIDKNEIKKEKKEFREGTPELTYYRKDGYLYAFDNKTDFLKAIFKLNSAGETEGPAITYYEDEKILSTLYLSPLGKQGYWTFYYRNGNIERKCPFYNDIENGIRETFYSNGKIREKISFKDDIENGRTILYYENGNIRESYFYKNGKKDGEIIKYYPNGKIALKGKLKNDIEDGNFEYYDENGNIEKKLIFKDGKILENK